MRCIEECNILEMFFFNSHSFALDPDHFIPRFIQVDFLKSSIMIIIFNLYVHFYLWRIQQGVIFSHIAVKREFYRI